MAKNIENINIIPQVLAIYLPQYYETEDNNKWWGKGFTDWEAVKKAKRIFTEQDFPNRPLNEKYYDLSKKENIKWQAELARKYGIDGFCFYHYWFKDGKKELEKPAEILLNSKDIDIKFCFNWANESWIRSWSNISGNVWSESFEHSNSDDSNGILVEQDYGEKENWDHHFYYLLPFFLDNRYIKIDGKPVFIFYRPLDIPCLRDMADRWTELAKKEGLKGIYYISVNIDASLLGLDASIIYQPRNAINNINETSDAQSLNGVRCFEYSQIWKEILKSGSYPGSKTYFMGVTGYDDTPRRGEKGECLIHRTPDIFSKNMKLLIEKSMALNNELVFINAWNEWGEGMYLEPDELWEYQYLEGISRARNDVSSEEISNIYINAEPVNIIENKKLLYNEIKYKQFLHYFDIWLTLERKNNFNIEKYLGDKEIHSAAIYGLGMLGKQLYYELSITDINISYAVDRYVGRFGENLNIIRPEADEWPLTDAVIITTYDEEAVAKFVSERTPAKIIRLSQILNDLSRQ